MTGNKTPSVYCAASRGLIQQLVKQFTAIKGKQRNTSIVSSEPPKRELCRLQALSNKCKDYNIIRGLPDKIAAATDEWCVVIKDVADATLQAEAQKQYDEFMRQAAWDDI